MTNTEKIAEACKPFVGKTLTSKMLVALVLDKYPDTNAGSILASDHAGPNPKSGVIYADQLFDRSSTGYVVRATSVPKPRTGRSKQSMADALAAANALLGVKVAAPQGTVVPAPKGNDKVQASA